MKKHVVALLVCTGYIAAQAQGGVAGKKPVEYITFMTLQPGEKTIPLYSCMWLNAKNEFYRLVIRKGNIYSVVTEAGRKDNLSQNQVRDHITSFNCDEKDPHRAFRGSIYRPLYNRWKKE